MRFRLLSLGLVTMLAPSAAMAVVPDWVPDVPLLGQQVPSGAGLITHSAVPMTPTPKTVDGSIEDWNGDISRYAGSAIYSHGEYVYQDHIGDNWGADRRRRSGARRNTRCAGRRRATHLPG